MGLRFTAEELLKVDHCGRHGAKESVSAALKKIARPHRLLVLVFFGQDTLLASVWPTVGKRDLQTPNKTNGNNLTRKNRQKYVARQRCSKKKTGCRLVLTMVCHGLQAYIGASRVPRSFPAAFHGCTPTVLRFSTMEHFGGTVWLETTLGRDDQQFKFFRRTSYTACSENNISCIQELIRIHISPPPNYKQTPSRILCFCVTFMVCLLA